MPKKIAVADLGIVSEVPQVNSEPAVAALLETESAKAAVAEPADVVEAPVIVGEGEPEVIIVNNYIIL